MGNVNMSEIDHLMPIMMKREEDAELSPLLSHGSTHFLYIKHNNLYCIPHYFAVIFIPCALRLLYSMYLILNSHMLVVAMTKKNTNAALVYSFLYKIVEVSMLYLKKN